MLITVNPPVIPNVFDPSGPRTHRPRAFTIFELLAVITLIVVLLTLLLPALQGAREAARQAVCASQLRQWGLGIYNYAMDQKMYLIWQDRDADEPGPVHSINDVVPHPMNHWPVRLIEMGLIESDFELSLLKCPTEVMGPLENFPISSSYGLNVGRGYGTSASDPFRGRHSQPEVAGAAADFYWPKLRDVPQPGDFAMVADSAQQEFDIVYGVLGQRIADDHGSHYGIRHRVGGNIAFFDNSVRYLKYEVAMFNYYGQNMTLVDPEYSGPLLTDP